VADEEEEERSRDPHPADLDKVDVEDIGFLGEVARCERRLVGLQDWVVG